MWTNRKIKKVNTQELNRGYKRCMKDPDNIRATYSMREDIGRGQYALVKRARHRISQNEVALKVTIK